MFCRLYLDYGYNYLYEWLETLEREGRLNIYRLSDTLTYKLKFCPIKISIDQGFLEQMLILNNIFTWLTDADKIKISLAVVLPEAVHEAFFTEYFGNTGQIEDENQELIESLCRYFSDQTGKMIPEDQAGIYFIFAIQDILNNDKYQDEGLLIKEIQSIFRYNQTREGSKK